MSSGKPTAVQRYALKFEEDAAGAQPTDGELRRVLGSELPHKLLDTVRREVVQARTRERVRLDSVRRFDENLRREATWHPVTGEHRYAKGDRVAVDCETVPPASAATVLGLAALGRYADEPDPVRWTVELGEPMPGGRRVICVPETALSPNTTT